jgi:N-acetylglutamate synthase
VSLIYKHIEEITLNTWPALQTILHQGWVLRCAEGYTKRANSVSPLYTSNQEDVEGLVQYCENFYNGLGQDAIFKITPYVIPSDLDTYLDNKGYIKVDESSVRILKLDRCRKPDLQTEIKDSLDEAWLDQVTLFNKLNDSQREITERMLKHSPLTQGYFTLYDEGIPVSCGLGVIDNQYVGLYDIVTNEEFRGRGYGYQLVLNILEWGRARGAIYSFLQVVERNHAATSLYDKVGYEPIYDYWYRVKRRS